MAARGSKPKLFGKTARKWALWVHVLSSALWLGAAVCVMLLGLARGARPQDASELYAFCLAVKLVDDYVIIGSCGLSALSGMLLSWKTPWGFFRWWWVAVKLVITLALLAVGALVLGPWINETEALVRSHGWAAKGLPRYASVERGVDVLGTIQIGVLGFVLYASIFKPWGKRGAQTRAD